MKKILKRISISLIMIWLIGVVYRIFFAKASGGAFVQQARYTQFDALIDGSLIVGIVLLIISAFFKKPGKSVSDGKKTDVKKDNVQELLQTLKDPNKRWESIIALGDKGDKRAIEPLKSFTRHIDPQIRGAAVIALGKIGGSQVVDTLIEVLNKEEGIVIRQFALDGLGDIGDGRAVTAIKQALTDENTSIRKHAQESLRKIKG